MSNPDTHYLITFKRPDRSVSHIVRDGVDHAQKTAAMLMDDGNVDIGVFVCVPVKEVVVKIQHTVTFPDFVELAE